MYYLCNDRQRQEKLASLILYTKHMLKSTYSITLLFTSNRIAMHSFRVYTITLKRSSEKKLQYIFLLKPDCVLYSFIINNFTLNDASLTLQRKQYQFFLKRYVQITLQINKYIWSYDSQSVNHGIWMYWG